jgi:hypothetical protein
MANIRVDGSIDVRAGELSKQVGGKEKTRNGKLHLFPPTWGALYPIRNVAVESYGKHHKILMICAREVTLRKIMTIKTAYLHCMRRLRPRKSGMAEISRVSVGVKRKQIDGGSQEAAADYK